MQNRKYSLNKKRIFLIRHGQTIYNRDQRKMGQLDSPLTQKGINQIKSIGKLLREKLRKYNDNILLLSSDLDRAVQSTSIIIKSLNGICHNVLYSNSLREVNLGTMSGLTELNIKKKYPYFKEDLNFVFPEGESFNQMKDRVESFLLKQIATNNKSTFIIISHAGPIRAIQAYFSNKTFKEMYQVHIKRCLYRIEISTEQDNGKLYIL